MKKASVLLLALSLAALVACSPANIRENGEDSGAVRELTQIFPAEREGDPVTTRGNPISPC